MRPLEPTLRALSDQLAAELPRQLVLFRESFPDFRCTTPVYFLFAAGAFDGATRQVGDRTAQLFGLDVIARIHGRQLAPLVVHGLFHVHHHALVPNAPRRLFWAVWQEGLATCVSRRLNPDVAETAVCCLPDVGAAPVALTHGRSGACASVPAPVAVAAARRDLPDPGTRAQVDGGQA